jgi:hypothetical protein
MIDMHWHRCSTPVYPSYDNNNNNNNNNKLLHPQELMHHLILVMMHDSFLMNYE